MLFSVNMSFEDCDCYLFFSGTHIDSENIWKWMEWSVTDFLSSLDQIFGLADKMPGGL